MTPNEAVEIAKSHLRKLVSDEKPFNMGLEEIKKTGNNWEISLGYSRQWDALAGTMAALVKPQRVFKTLVIDNAGELSSMKNMALPPLS